MKRMCHIIATIFVLFEEIKSRLQHDKILAKLSIRLFIMSKLKITRFLNLSCKTKQIYYTGIPTHYEPLVTT